MDPLSVESDAAPREAFHPSPIKHQRKVFLCVFLILISIVFFLISYSIRTHISEQELAVKYSMESAREHFEYQNRLTEVDLISKRLSPEQVAARAQDYKYDISTKEQYLEKLSEARLSLSWNFLKAGLLFFLIGIAIVIRLWAW